MTIVHSLILGIIEGITEFLPISSTGHLILVGHILGLSSTDFLKSFDIVIQLGAIASVLVLYWKLFLDIEVLKKLVVGFIPTGIIGLLLYKFVKTYLIGNVNVVVWALLIGGVALIVFEYFHKRSFAQVHDMVDMPTSERIRSLTYKQVMLVGLFQSIALVPGVSRSAATIVGGLLVGLQRKTIIEFSFLLAVPTLLAASGLDIIKNHSAFSVDQTGLLITGFIAAFITALLSIKFLLGFIKKRNFVAFGVYRIVLALVFLLYII